MSGGQTVRWWIVWLDEYPSGKCADSMQDYKSARLTVIICAILVNTQTHTHRESFWQAILLAQPAELKQFTSYQNAVYTQRGWSLRTNRTPSSLTFTETKYALTQITTSCVPCLCNEKIRRKQSGKRNYNFIGHRDSHASIYYHDVHVVAFFIRALDSASRPNIQIHHTVQQLFTELLH